MLWKKESPSAPSCPSCPGCPSAPSLPGSPVAWPMSFHVAPLSMESIQRPFSIFSNGVMRVMLMPLCEASTSRCSALMLAFICVHCRSKLSTRFSKLPTRPASAESS